MDSPTGRALAAAREVRSPAVMVLELAMPAFGRIDVMKITGQEHLPVSFVVNSALGQDFLHRPLQTVHSCGATVLGAVSKPLTESKLAPLLAQHRQDKRRGAHSRIAANAMGKLH